jgi:hypothetical protein
MSNSQTYKSSYREYTTPPSSYTTPPCVALCAVNSLATATWPVTAPLCPALDRTGATTRCNPPSPSLNATTEADGRPPRRILVTSPRQISLFPSSGFIKPKGFKLSINLIIATSSVSMFRHMVLTSIFLNNFFQNNNQEMDLVSFFDYVFLFLEKLHYYSRMVAKFI